MTLPKTSGVPLMVMTAIIEKKVKFTGSPQKLPRRTSFMFLQ